MNFMFEWQELEIQFLPRELKIHIFELTFNVFLLYKRADDAVFNYFPKISDHFTKISQGFSKIVPKARRTFPNIYRTFPNILRRLPKMFRSYTNKF